MKSLQSILNCPSLKHASLINKGRDLLLSILRTIFLICMSFIVLYPLLYMISVSIRDSLDLYDPTIIWIPKTFTLQNYFDVLKNFDYPILLKNTVFISLVSTILNVICCGLAGYGFARFQFFAKKLLFAFVIIMIIIPPQNISIPMYLQYYQFDFFGIGKLFHFHVNLLNSSMVFFIPAIFGNGIRSGLFIFIFRQFFRGMPKEFEEAAYIDGCGIIRTFLRIMLPNAKSSIISCFLFSFVWYWNDYYLTNMYFDSPCTITVALGMLKDTLRSQGMDYFSNPYVIVTQLQAACFLSIIPLLLIFIILQNFFTESVERTGLVG